MPRTNPQAEALQRENRLLRDQINRICRDPGEIPADLGCGDSSCIVRRPSGMATNGGCRCEERTLRRAVMFWRMRCVYLQAVRELPSAAEDPSNAP